MKKTQTASSVSLPRVLYAVVLEPSNKFGSLEEEIVSLAQCFKLNGSLFQPLFICCERNSYPASYLDLGIEPLCLDLLTFSWSRLMRLSKLISKQGIALIHWNFTELLRNKYVWWLTLLHPNVKHCYTDHISRISTSRQPTGPLKKTVKKLLLRRYDKVFCVSKFILDDLLRQGTCSNLMIVRHFINTERFRPDSGVRDSLRKEFNVEGSFVVLAVAHLIKEKGMQVLIRAMTELPNNVSLWIVGDGVESEALHQLSHELNLEPRIRFHGLQKNVVPFMQAADCFVCPSLWEEAAGLVVLEAIASGLPIIASRIGGIPEYVENGITGFLFTPGDHREIARFATILKDNPVLYHQMSLKARSTALERFSADVLVPSHLNGYRA